MSRNYLIDSVKGVGIVFVVLGHNWIVLHEKGELFRMIFSFHMPLFFFVAGVFINSSESYFVFFCKKIDSLVKPYFSAVSLTFLAQVMASGSYNVVWVDSVINIFYGTGMAIPNVPLWFLLSLFVCVLFSFVVVRLLGESKLSLMLFSVFLFSLGYFLITAVNFGAFDYPWIRGDSYGLPWSLDLLPICSAFVMAGYAFRREVISFNYSPIFFFVSLVMFFLLHYFFDETIDLNLRVVGYCFVVILQIITGVYLVFCLSYFLNYFDCLRRIFSFLGEASLFILLFHSPVQNLAFSFFSGFNSGSFVASVASFFCAIIIPVLVYWFIVKYDFGKFLFFPIRVLHK